MVLMLYNHFWGESAKINVDLQSLAFRKGLEDRNADVAMTHLHWAEIW